MDIWILIFLYVINFVLALYGFKLMVRYNEEYWSHWIGVLLFCVGGGSFPVYGAYILIYI